MTSRPGDFDDTVVLHTTAQGDPNATVVLPASQSTQPRERFDETVVLPASPLIAAGAPAPSPLTADPPAAPALSQSSPPAAPPAAPPPAAPPPAAPPPAAPPPAAGGQPGRQPESGSVVRNSAVMAAGSIVSRFTGLLRVAAIGAALGATFVNDDYQLAIALPNMVFELLVGGVLASVIVPTLVRRRKHDPDDGQAYAQRLLSLAAVALGVATALTVLAAPLITWAMARKASDVDRELITHLAYLILPALFFYGMAALCGALLNAIPGITVDVDRSVHVRIRAQDETGAERRVEASGLEARVIQHEIDHLDGVLILDRTSKEQRKEAMRALREAEEQQQAA